jgi:hypothetical protein
MGRVLGARGDFPEALDQLERFEREAPPDLRAQVPALEQLIANVRAKVATLRITGDAPGARVVLRDKIVGTLPLDPLRVTAGDAVIQVTADGYAPFRQDLKLVGGVTTVVVVKLVPIAKGVLSIRTSGGGGTVFVDGRSMGEAPVEAAVSPGEHRITIQRKGYDDQDTTVVVAASERKVVTLERPGVFTRWWFWTTVGVVVCSAGVLSVALLTERKAGTGDGFRPGQVPSALVRW